MKKIFLAFLMFTLCAPLFAQTVKKVKEVQGRYQIYSNISEEMAQKKALQEAKTEALRKAGVSENVYSAFGMISDSDGQTFNEVYSEMSMLTIDGLVNVTKIYPYTVENDPRDGKRYAVATIDAEVRKGEQPDKAYQLYVTRLDNLYKVNDEIKFDVKVYGADSYLNIFWFDEKEGGKIFPTVRDADNIIKKGISYTIPRRNDITYEALLSNPKSSSETAHVMVIATKKEYPYIGDEATYESVLRWINSIPVQDRCTFHQPITIKR